MGHEANEIIQGQASKKSFVVLGETPTNPYVFNPDR